MSYFYLLTFYSLQLITFLLISKILLTNNVMEVVRAGFIFLIYFSKALFFQVSFRFTGKWRGGYRAFSFAPDPRPHTHSSPIINIPYWSSIFVTIDEPRLTHCHPKSAVYMRVRSWCGTFYEFGQMDNDCVHHQNVRAFSLP